VLDRFFAVLNITPSFLVRFWPVKCRIEALITFFRMVQGRSVRFSFRSGQRSGQTWSNLVNLGQTWSNLVKALQTLGNVSRTTFRGFLGTVGPSRVGNGSVKPRSNLVNPSQIWSNHGKCVPDLLLGSIRCGKASSNHAGSVRAVPFCVPTPEKIPWVKMGL
jgi:hypothetical protein